MYSIVTTEEFDAWMNKLKDRRGKARILARVRSAELGNLGDFTSVGGGISEMRVHYGPGYRLYFTRKGRQIVILLLGGDKASQKQDIERAMRMKAEIEE